MRRLVQVFSLRMPLHRLPLFFLLMLTMGSPWVEMISAQAQGFSPSGRGMPGRRAGGGTRGPIQSDPSSTQPGVQQPALTALIPETNLGLTLAERPTFFWYVPPTSATVAEFVLLDETNAEVYKTHLPIAGQSGIISFSLPADASPLEAETLYHWYFSLVYDPLDRSSDQFTDGWVQRITPTAPLSAQLATATESEKLVLYTQAGIWHEAIATLAALRLEQPNNTDWVQQWQTLLKSVKLDEVVDQPLAAQSTSEIRF